MKPFDKLKWSGEKMRRVADIVNSVHPNARMDVSKLMDIDLTESHPVTQTIFAAINAVKTKSNKKPKRKTHVKKTNSRKAKRTR